MYEDYFLERSEKLREYFGKIAIILHGSRIKGEFYPASDLDVLIITEKCFNRKGFDIAYSILGEEIDKVRIDIQVICYEKKDYFFVRNVLANKHIVVVDDFKEFK